MSSDFISTTDRPVALRRRPDLEVRRQSYLGREYWVVKDPLSLKYFRFEDEEYAILSLLDGTVSLEKIRGQFENRFAPQQISNRELHHLIGQMYRSGLVLSELPGQGDQLIERDDRRRWQHLLGGLQNLLALRLRGVDPDRLLTWLNRRVGWIFSLPVLLVALCLMAGALLLIGAEFEVFRSRLPQFQQFFAVQNWFWLAATLAVTKILHEFGHGLSCKRFGGECHEMGMMLLVFTPCLYCNVTDSWMIPSKWRRAAVGAAGMYVELVLASLATLIWWYSQPGMLNGLCLNVMFVCSVSTLLFNANPLMRYDGYYILSDLLEIPNLRQKALLVLNRQLGAWFFGAAAPHDPFLPWRRQWAFAAYSIAAALYGWLVTFSIFWFLYRVLEPYGLKIVGQMLAVAMVLALVVTPLVKLVQFFRIPGRTAKMKPLRVAFILAVAGGGLAAALLAPLPYYVTCSLHIQPRNAAAVYVDVPGEIQQIHARGGAVRAGDLLLELENSDARAAQRKLQSQRDKLATRVASLHQRSHTDETAHLELAETQESLLAVNAQLAKRRQEINKLVIRAPVDGLIVPPPARARKSSDVKTLPVWAGRPLELHNVGAYLEASTLVCRIAQPGEWEAILLIDQEEIEFVNARQPVDLYLDGLPGRKLTGQVDQISQEDMHSAPTNVSLKSGGDLATRTDAAGVERPLEVTYQASVSLDDKTGAIGMGAIVTGATGSAKIHAGYQPLARRLWRLACRTFQFEM